MRCLCIITSLPIGGAEKSLLRLIENSHKEIEYLVISLDEKKDLEVAFNKIGVQVVNLNLKKLKTLFSSIFTTFKLIRNWKPDLIYAWMYHAMLFSVIGKIFFPRIKLFWGIRHNNLNIRLNKLTTVLIARLLALLSSMPQKIVYCSDKSMILHLKFGYSKSNAILIENGFDCAKFKHKNSLLSKDLKKIKLNHFPNIDPQAFIIGCCARYDPLKRFENFISIAKTLLEDPNSNIVFCLVGEGLINKRQLLLQKVPAKDHVKFVFMDSTPAINEVFLCMDILVQTSVSESFPNVLPEAMLSGVPVVATNVGQTNRIVGDCGILVPPDDIEATTEAVKMLIADSKLHKRFALLGSERIRDEFDVNRYVETHLKMFKDAI